MSTSREAWKHPNGGEVVEEARGVGGRGGGYKHHVDGGDRSEAAAQHGAHRAPSQRTVERHRPQELLRRRLLRLLRQLLRLHS